MIIKPSFKADKFCNPKGSLNAKILGYFKASAGFRVALPSLRPFLNKSLAGHFYQTTRNGKLSPVGLIKTHDNSLRDNHATSERPEYHATNRVCSSFDCNGYSDLSA
jgi:hypothetical protein